MSNNNGGCQGGSGCQSGGASCQGSGANTAADERQMKEMMENEELKASLDKIKNKIVVLSGKGGVGKSTVAVNLATGLANRGLRVGLLDVDIHGPSVPKLLGLENESLKADEANKLIPAIYKDNMKVISIGFLMPDNDDAVIWRGPLKHGAIKQFLKDVLWGELDYLIIDSPPGTGDEPLAVCQLIEDPTGAVVVTTPQDVALSDVRKSITFCHKLEMPIIGVVENMSGFTCPHCGETIDILKKGGGKKMAEDMNVPFIGSIPIDVQIAERGDSGNPYINDHLESDSEAVKALGNMVEKIVAGVKA